MINQAQLAVAAVLLATPAAAQSDSHKQCPMMASGQHPSAVDQRHDQVTGVGHQESVHHFRLAPDGGSIRLEMAKGGSREDRDRIRLHLKHIAKAFAAADFTLPMFIHDQDPPGIDVMKARRSLILYEYSETKSGGEIRISTRDAEARSAVHAFLRFQIQDHRTGDPTTFD